jgi:AcrR family transcriptional regulator
MRDVKADLRTKGERTRQRVIELAAPVFNRRGYWGASLRDVMDSTGLEKGGIYNHFASKNELALAAFDHNVDRIRSLIREALAGRRHAIERLVAILDAYRRFALEPSIPGGCPLLNTSVEADDTHPELRDRARAVMSEMLDGTIARIVRRGIQRNEIRADVDPDAVASAFVAGIEGGLLLSQLYGDPSHMERVADHFDGFVRSLAVEERES